VREINTSTEPIFQSETVPHERLRNGTAFFARQQWFALVVVLCGETQEGPSGSIASTKIGRLCCDGATPACSLDLQVRHARSTRLRADCPVSKRNCSSGDYARPISLQFEGRWTLD
jgi:hypothetical protein